MKGRAFGRAVAHDHVDIYPVGVLADLRRCWRALRVRPPIGRVAFWRRIIRMWRRRLAQQIKARKWRDLKNNFNGYLAEPYHWPQDGTLRRCGSGWTKARAMRSLRSHGWRY